VSDLVCWVLYAMLCLVHWVLYAVSCMDSCNHLLSMCVKKACTSSKAIIIDIVSGKAGGWCQPKISWTSCRHQCATVSFNQEVTSAHESVLNQHNCNRRGNGRLISRQQLRAACSSPVVHLKVCGLGINHVNIIAGVCGRQVWVSGSPRAAGNSPAVWGWCAGVLRCLESGAQSSP